MSERKKSKEELYLKKIYELAKEDEIDRYKVGRALSEHTRSVNNIVQLLAKNGFIKKNGDTLIRLTPSGIRYLEMSL
ncbi:MAG: hypothetical protein K1000chlam2_00329 [Chlamydiae bacterium]|nr:hypothetical protein [Chlamydiota bacterium]